VSQDVNVLALVKGEERFLFLYTDDNRTETLRTLGRFASDPDINFSWYDAAVLSQRLRRHSAEQGSSRLEPSAPDPKSPELDWVDSDWAWED